MKLLNLVCCLCLTIQMVGCSKDAPVEIVGFTSLNDVSVCPYGGTYVQAGQDQNRDGVLQVDEVERSFPLCNGQNGHLSLIRTETYSGSECGARGGVRVLSGLDEDDNGSLDDSEISETSYVCHGNNGLVRSEAATLTQCEQTGGRVFHFGIDTDGNNYLDAEEITSSYPVCNGQTPKIETTNIEPGSTCELGGLHIVVGFEVDGTPGLTGGEIQSTTNFCNRRIDGANSVVRFSTIPTGSNLCPFGGQLFQVGRDRDSSNTLEDLEIEHQRAICNGHDGRNSEVRIETLGLNQGGCEFGGSRVNAGLDLDRDGYLDTEEITSSNVICSTAVNQFKTLVRYEAIAAGSVTCQWGGVRTLVGGDDNNNNYLDASEVDSSVNNCNQVQLLAGTNALTSTAQATTATCPFGGIMLRTGSDDNRDNVLQAGEVDQTNAICNGHDGYDTRTISTSYTGASCGINGGVRFQTGLDISRNNVLDASEILSTSIVCHGDNGLDGYDGFDGLNSLIAITTDGGACDFGGFGIQVGTDLNYNGVLNSSEVEDFEVVCNGANGYQSLVEVFEETYYCTNGGFYIESGLDIDEDGILDSGEVTNNATSCF